MSLSASFEVVGIGREKVRRRGDPKVSTKAHGSLNDTPGGGQMAKAFAWTMKRTVTNNLYPKTDVGEHKPQERNGYLIIEKNLT